jgi:putative DNA primase/helicase
MYNVFYDANKRKLRIIDKYGPAKGDLVHCPAHDDKNPSLQITVTDNKLLWHCHAGCSQEAVREQLVADGLWPAKIDTSTSAGQIPNSQSRADKNDRDKINHQELLDACIGWEDLKDEQRDILQRYARSRSIQMPDTVLFLAPNKSKRLTGRYFPAMVFEIAVGSAITGAHITWLASNGSSKLAVDDPKRTYGRVKDSKIYLHDEYDRHEPIVVAEGIETALSVEKITGLKAVAACNAANLGRISVPKSSEIIIAADNDPAGLEGANKLARRLSAEGRIVRVAMPFPRGNQKRDWNDELRDPKSDIELLNRQIREARQYDAIGAVSAGDFLQMDFPPRPSMLHPWLPTAGLAMVHAPRGAAKTWFCLSAAHAIVTGKMLLDWKVNARGRVLYVDGELPATVLQTRLRHFDWDGNQDDMLVLSKHPA